MIRGTEVLHEQNRYNFQISLPCTPLGYEDLFRNSIVLVQTVEAQNAENNPWY